MYLHSVTLIKCVIVMSNGGELVIMLYIVITDSSKLAHLSCNSCRFKHKLIWIFCFLQPFLPEILNNNKYGIVDKVQRSSSPQLTHFLT